MAALVLVARKLWRPRRDVAAKQIDAMPLNLLPSSLLSCWLKIVVADGFLLADVRRIGFTKAQAHRNRARILENEQVQECSKRVSVTIPGQLRTKAPARCGRYPCSFSIFFVPFFCLWPTVCVVIKGKKGTRSGSRMWSGAGGRCRLDLSVAE